MNHRPPRTTAATRAEQLRRAKRAQRAREREAGLVTTQLTLPKETARKLAAARRAEHWPHLLDQALDRILVRLADYAQLQDLAWNRVDDYIPAPEALALYERNWRLVDPDTLEPAERELIERLKAEFGNGELNA